MDRLLGTGDLRLSTRWGKGDLGGSDSLCLAAWPETFSRFWETANCQSWPKPKPKSKPKTRFLNHSRLASLPRQPWVNQTSDFAGCTQQSAGCQPHIKDCSTQLSTCQWREILVYDPTLLLDWQVVMMHLGSDPRSQNHAFCGISTCGMAWGSIARIRIRSHHSIKLLCARALYYWI